MSKAVISKDVLDTLIRAKVSTVPRCAGITPMPVAWKRDANGCNWEVPGWTGANGSLANCMDEIRSYLQMLRSQFDIPPEG